MCIRDRLMWVCYVCVLTPFLSVYGCVVQLSGPVWWDPDPLRDIGFGAGYRPDALAIQRPIHEMICKLVLVRAVKTRRRFGSKTASFHVSVVLMSFSYLPLSICICVLLLLFHVIIWCILPVWLLVSLDETSMIVHLNCVVDMCLYQRHFMCM